MSYTTGGQTIDKSMNGILSFNGESVVADDITATNITATNLATDNITCETLEVNTSATFNGTASFNTALPTSSITSATNNDEFITLGIGNSLYASGSILGSNNTWTGQNYYNTILPTSTLTGTPTLNDIAPVAMLNNLYARLASTNFFSGSNSFSAGLSASYLQTLFISWSQFSGDIVEQTFDTLTGIFKTISYNNGTSARFDFGFFTSVIPVVEVIKFRIQETVSTFFTRVQVQTPDTTNTNSTALSLTNSNATPTSLNMSLSWNGGVNGIIQAGDTAIIARTVLDSATTALVLAPWSSTNCGIRITKDDVTMLGLTNNFSATTTNITGATNFTSLPSTTTTFTTATSNQFITKNIGDNLYTVAGGYARLTTVDNAFTNNNTFVNLPSTTTTFTTATANQFITKSIGDALYPSIPAGGYARLTTVDNTFTNNNTFLTDGGTGNTIMYGAGVFLSATDNIAEATAGGTLATPAFTIRGRGSNSKIIKFIPNATASALNPLVAVNDGVISADTALSLTAEGTTAVGIRIVDDGNMFIRGTTVTFPATNTNTIIYGTGVFLSATSNIAESTSNVALATPAFTVRGRSANTKTIKFIPQATVGALNPAVLVNDSVISADAVLTLTADGATTTGIRILDTGVVNVVGVTNNLGSATTNINSTTLTVSASTSSTFNSFVTFNNQVPLINIDATGTPSTKQAVNWAVVTSRLATTVSNLLGGINTWTQSNTYNTSISQLLPFIYNFAGAQAYANTGMVGYSLNNTVRLVATITGVNYTNVASIALPAAYGMWRIDFECEFSTVTDGFYSMGITTTSGGTPLVFSGQEAHARTASSGLTINTSLIFKNSALNQTVYGVARASLTTGIIDVAIRFTRLG